MNFPRAPHASLTSLRIGILGGSFNPAHEGHLHAARLALKQLKLDRVWFLVSPQNPLKDEKGMASLEKRLQNARKLAESDPRIDVTDIETALGTRYTIDTLRALKRRFPGARFVWLMGSDNLLQMPQWKDWRAIFRLVPIAVIARPGTAFLARTGEAAQVLARYRRHGDARLADTKPPAWVLLDARRNTESATRLRAKGLG